MSRCLVGLGSNVGERARQLDRAVARLAHHPQVGEVVESSRRETRAVGGPSGQPDYLNSVVGCETELSPFAFLDHLLEVERDLGRERSQRWAARTIDLDLLLYGGEQICTERLVLPHPRMAYRRFVLASAAEIAGDMVHPATGFTLRELLRRLDQAPAYVAVTGELTGRRRAAVQQAAQVLGCVAVTDPAPSGWSARARKSTASRTVPTDETSGGWTGGSWDRLVNEAGGGGEENWQAHLDLLEARVAALHAATLRRGSASAREHVISDFWIGESLALADIASPICDRSPFNAIWDTIPDSLVLPKLLVYCLPPGDTMESAPVSSRNWERELRRLASRPRQFPVLWLAAQDVAEACREITASLLAMQSDA